MTGAEMIMDERNRQVAEEGWNATHDDEHINEELAKAAACYALPESERANHQRYEKLGLTEKFWYPRWWPWMSKWWKPSPYDRIRELVKAGALCAAEIDRLQRLKRNS